MNEQKQTTQGGSRPRRRPRPSARKTAPTKKAASRGGRRPSRKGGGRRRSSGIARKPRSFTNPALKHRMAQPDEKTVPIPPITDEDTVRVIPISGVEEIGRNMNVVETKDDIVIFDAGFQFVSEESNAPGINYILPNTQYLEENKHKIRAIVLTHAHLDHIGGIPFIMERIGNPPIYTQYLTSLMVLKRQEEFPHLEPLDMHVVKEGESFVLGNNLKIQTFPVTHSIPDAMGVSVITKYGNVVLTGDVRLAHVDGKPDPKEEQWWKEVGQNNNLAMIIDSTNADRDGFSLPETEVFKNLEQIVKNTSGRLIIGTFASQFERLISVIKACEEYGKVVVPEGRSLKTNIDIALTAKLLEVKPGVIISAQEAEHYPADRVVVISTGAQGEEFAALMRMASGKHKFITLNERDTVVLSSSVIPGNEIAVQKLKDNIYRRNVKVINYRGANVHSSGHGNAGELGWIRNTVKPKFLIPVHGHHFHLKSHMYSAVENGFPRENIVVPDNGSIIEIYKDESIKVLPMKIPTADIMVDGFTVGAKQEVVLRDRQSLAEDGMFVIIATINPRTGKLRKSPDIISRGFVYLRENQQLLSEARILIKKTIEKLSAGSHPIDLDYIKDEVTNTVSGFLLQKTNKTPMVIPVLIGI